MNLSRRASGAEALRHPKALTGYCCTSTSALLLLRFYFGTSISTFSTWMVLVLGSREPVILAFWPAHGVLPVKAVNGFAGSKDEFAAQVLDAVERTGSGGAAHGLGLEHLLVRAGERVNVECALAVRDFAAEDFLILLVILALGLRGYCPEY